MLVTEQSFTTDLRQPNAGNVARLKLLAIDSVLAVISPRPGPAVAGTLQAGPFTVSRYGLPVSGGYDLTEIIFPFGACSFVEVSTRDQAGTVWAPELQAAIPKNQPALLDWLDRNQTRRWLAIWLDRNGLAYVAGEPGNGLRMDVSRAVSAGNSVGLTLKGRFTHATWFLETFDAGELFAHADFDQSFDLSFTS
ncbi:hypothetical protein GCM10028807_17370 [Spirosoma daeguense]